MNDLIATRERLVRANKDWREGTRGVARATSQGLLSEEDAAERLRFLTLRRTLAGQDYTRVRRQLNRKGI